MDDKLSDDEGTHEVMDALKEVLDTYARSHSINYEMVETDPGVNARFVVVHVRVPT